MNIRNESACYKIKKSAYCVIFALSLNSIVTKTIEKNHEEDVKIVSTGLNFKDKKKEAEDALAFILLKKHVIEWDNKNSVDLLGRRLSKDEIKKIVSLIKNDESVVQEIILFFTKYLVNEEESLKFNNKFRFMIKWLFFPSQVLLTISGILAVCKDIVDYNDSKNKDLIELIVGISFNSTVDYFFGYLPLKYFYNYLKKNNYTEGINEKSVQVEALLNKKIHDLVLLLGIAKTN